MQRLAKPLYHTLTLTVLYMFFTATLMHDLAVSFANSADHTPAPPPGILVADHFVQHFGYFALRPQGTRDWLITFTRAGAGCYRLAGSEFICTAGDVLILEAGAPHDYATAPSPEPWDFYWAHFTPRPHWVRWLQLAEIAPGLRHQAIREATRLARVESAFVRLLSDCHGVGEWQDELTANALEEILILTSQQRARNSSRASDPRIEAVLAYLNQHFRDAITIEQLASRVVLSPSRLAHLFKEETGEAIMEMVLRLRLRQAARLLEFTTLPVGEVAHEVGFQSPFYFSRQFSAYFGRSPQAYRRETQVA